MQTDQLFGDKAALKALKEGEESGLEEYEEVGDTVIPQDQKTLVSVYSQPSGCTFKHSTA